jgi:hypothetical protein
MVIFSFISSFVLPQSLAFSGLITAAESISAVTSRFICSFSGSFVRTLNFWVTLWPPLPAVETFTLIFPAAPG